jgi:hypothetical protein
MISRPCFTGQLQSSGWCAAEDDVPEEYTGKDLFRLIAIVADSRRNRAHYRDCEVLRCSQFLD